MKLTNTLTLLLTTPTLSLVPPSPQHPLRTRTILHRVGDRKRRGRRRITRRPKHYYPTAFDEVDDISCPIEYTDEPIDHSGLSKSIDEEYALEESKIDLTFWEIFKREQYRIPSEFSSHMSPLQRTLRRMDFKKGNVESKYQLMSPRDYGSRELLDKDHLVNPPTLDDLNQKPATFRQTYWKQPLFRVAVVAGAYTSFPYWCRLVKIFQTIEPAKFTTLVNQLGPNVGVLYATILSLTLAVLYNRFCRIQNNVTTEASLLSGLTRNLLSLFQDDPKWATDACQMIANQLRIMLSRTRGVELLSIMKADTYSNILALVDDYHYLHGCDEAFTSAQESTMSNIRQDLTHIMEVRALRLSDEASSLPPTHFLLLTTLSMVSALAFVTASLAVVGDLDNPPIEARLLFSGLIAMYVLFFNFCRDLNGPFQGVYQIKRSNAVSHLLQVKWLIVNQLGDSINFGEFEDTSQDEQENLSLFDRVKLFFSDVAASKPEEIAQVEVDTMATLVKELEEHNQVVPSSPTSDETAESVTPSVQTDGDDSSASVRDSMSPEHSNDNVSVEARTVSSAFGSTNHVEPTDELTASDGSVSVSNDVNHQVEVIDEIKHSASGSISHVESKDMTASDVPMSVSDEINHQVEVIDELEDTMSIVSTSQHNGHHQEEKTNEAQTTLNVSLDFNDDSGTKKHVTVSHVPHGNVDLDLPTADNLEKKVDSRQFDYAGYFRSAGGFSS